MARARRSKDEGSDKNRRSSKDRKSAAKDQKVSKENRQSTERKIGDVKMPKNDSYKDMENFGESGSIPMHQKTLLDETWNRLTEMEENLHVVLDVREDLMEQVLKECQERYIARQAIKFHAHCVHRALMDLFGTVFLARDPGPEAPWSKKLQPLEAPPPPPHPGDSWATGTVSRAPPPPGDRYDHRSVGHAGCIKIPMYEPERQPPTPPALDPFDETLVRREDEQRASFEPPAPPPSLIMLPDITTPSVGEEEGENAMIRSSRRRRTRASRRRVSRHGSDKPPSMAAAAAAAAVAAAPKHPGSSLLAIEETLRTSHISLARLPGDRVPVFALLKEKKQRTSIESEEPDYSKDTKPPDSRKDHKDETPISDPNKSRFRKPARKGKHHKVPPPTPTLSATQPQPFRAPSPDFPLPPPRPIPQQRKPTGVGFEEPFMRKGPKKTRKSRKQSKDSSSSDEAPTDYEAYKHDPRTQPTVKKHKDRVSRPSSPPSQPRREISDNRLFRRPSEWRTDRASQRLKEMGVDSDEDLMVAPQHPAQGKSRHPSRTYDGTRPSSQTAPQQPWQDKHKDIAHGQPPDRRPQRPGEPSQPKDQGDRRREVQGPLDADKKIATRDRMPSQQSEAGGAARDSIQEIIKRASSEIEEQTRKIIDKAIDTLPSDSRELHPSRESRRPGSTDAGKESRQPKDYLTLPDSSGSRPQKDGQDISGFKTREPSEPSGRKDSPREMEHPKAQRDTTDYKPDQERKGSRSPTETYPMDMQRRESRGSKDDDKRRDRKMGRDETKPSEADKRGDAPSGTSGKYPDEDRKEDSPRDVSSPEALPSSAKSKPKDTSPEREKTDGPKQDKDQEKTKTKESPRYEENQKSKPASPQAEGSKAKARQSPEGPRRSSYTPTPRDKTEEKEKPDASRIEAARVAAERAVDAAVDAARWLLQRPSFQNMDRGKAVLEAREALRRALEAAADVMSGKQASPPSTPDSPTTKRPPPRSQILRPHQPHAITSDTQFFQPVIPDDSPCIRCPETETEGVCPEQMEPENLCECSDEEEKPQPPPPLPPSPEKAITPGLEEGRSRHEHHHHKHHHPHHRPRVSDVQWDDRSRSRTDSRRPRTKDSAKSSSKQRPRSDGSWYRKRPKRNESAKESQTQESAHRSRSPERREGSVKSYSPDSPLTPNSPSGDQTTAPTEKETATQDFIQNMLL